MKGNNGTVDLINQINHFQFASAVVRPREFSPNLLFKMESLALQVAANGL